MRSPGKFISVLLLALLASAAYGENVRGKLAAGISAEGEQTASFTIDTLVVVGADLENDLIQGIELKLSIPPEIRRYRDSFVLYLYQNVSPAPDPSITSYYGNRLFRYIVPSMSKFYIQIPVSREYKLEPIQGTKIIDTVVSAESFPLVLSILPVMKGIPPEVYSSTLEVTAKPVYFPKGKLALSIVDGGNGEKIDPSVGVLTINDSEMEYHEEPVPLRTGIHTITIDIPGYQEQTANFTIEEGSTSAIALQLTRTVPTFTIEAPREAEVFIDGTLYDGILGRMEEIAPGTHTVLFKIGDYSISKKFEINEGKNYNISLFFDIFIKED